MGVERGDRGTLLGSYYFEKGQVASKPLQSSSRDDQPSLRDDIILVVFMIQVFNLSVAHRASPAYKPIAKYAAL